MIVIVAVLLILFLSVDDSFNSKALYISRGVHRVFNKAELDDNSVDVEDSKER